MEYRREHDSMGEVLVPADALWGAQTQRSHENFPIGTERMPHEIIRAFAVLKKAAALANASLGRMDEKDAELIAQVADEILAGKLDDQFPLVVWQTGSGTQSNMNVNEVIANRGNAIAGERRLHPNDSVNMSQSSNDTFPTALHIAAATAITQDLLPAIDQLVATLRQLEERSAGIVKCGAGARTCRTPCPLPSRRRSLAGAACWRTRASSSRSRCPASIAWRSAAPPWAPASTLLLALTPPLPRRSPASRACRSSRRPTSSRLSPARMPSRLRTGRSARLPPT